MSIEKEREIVERFVKTKIERDIKSFETNVSIYSAFLDFCKKENIEPITKTKLGKRLNELAIGIKHTPMKNYEYVPGRQGVRLK